MALKFISTIFHLFCSLNISTSLSRSLSVRVSFLSFTMCIMASRLFCESMFLEFVHMSFIRLKDLSTDCVDSKLFYYLKSKLINSLLFSPFPNSQNLRANFPNSKGPGPKIQISRKITAQGLTCCVCDGTCSIFNSFSGLID